MSAVVFGFSHMCINTHTNTNARTRGYTHTHGNTHTFTHTLGHTHTRELALAHTLTKGKLHEYKIYIDK